MSAAWIRNLEAGETLVIDGGTGSELERRGMPLRRQDVWSGLASVTHFERAARRFIATTSTPARA